MVYFENGANESSKYLQFSWRGVRKGVFLCFVKLNVGFNVPFGHQSKGPYFPMRDATAFVKLSRDLRTCSSSEDPPPYHPYQCLCIRVTLANLRTLVSARLKCFLIALSSLSGLITFNAYTNREVLVAITVKNNCS